MALPRGVSGKDFSAALQEFANVVGNDWVFSKEEDIATYRDPYSPFIGEPDKEFIAGAAVAPASVEQVQQIVRVANKYKIPLYPISTGRNLGYGGPSPTYTGSVVVDLRRMDKVIEVNERESYMIVEPGINFIQLQRYFDDHNLPFIAASPQPGWGSPIGNALDHGISGAAGDNFGMVHGMEVVLASGEVLRTGMGGVPTSKMWANYRYGFGPFLNGIFSQSNFGIVTKMLFWLVRKPDMEQGFTIESYKNDDLQPILDASQILREQGLIYTASVGSPIRESTATNDGRRPFGPAEVKALHHRRDGGTPAEWEKLGRDHNIPIVSARCAARGPDAVVKITLEHARDVFGKIPGVIFKEGRIIRYEEGKVPFPPSIDFGLLAVQGTNHGHYYFSPMLRPLAQDMFEINDIMRNAMLDADDNEMLDSYGWSGGDGSSFQKAYMIRCEFLVYNDVQKNRKRRELFLNLIKACAEKGWADYRAPVAFQTEVMNTYSFNNHIQRRFCEAIKDAIDPNGILAPGKSGIWPKHLRKAQDHE